ncbi:MAG: hypothetical protein QXZ17_06545 [Nitrososphaerota archaeon]
MQVKRTGGAISTSNASSAATRLTETGGKPQHRPEGDPSSRPG